MKYLLALICLFVATSAMAQEPLYGVIQSDTQEVKLPQDQGKWHLSVFGNVGDPRFDEVVSWFDSNPQLKTLKAQVHFHVYPSDSPTFDRYKNLPALPCIRLQNAKGKVQSEFYGDYIPVSPDALYNGIRKDLSTQGCPWTRPKPPTPPVIPSPIDTPPIFDKPVDKPGFPWGLAILSTLIGAGVGVWLGYKDEQKL